MVGETGIQTHDASWTFREKWLNLKQSNRNNNNSVNFKARNIQILQPKNSSNSIQNEIINVKTALFNKFTLLNSLSCKKKYSESYKMCL